MLSVTPIRAKNVSFQLPGSTQRANSAPPIPAAARSLKSPLPRHHQRGGDKHAALLSKLAPAVARISSPQPDLIADILDQPEDAQAKAKPKKVAAWSLKDPQIDGTEAKKIKQTPAQSGHSEAGKKEQTSAQSDRIEARKSEQKTAKGVPDQKAPSKAKQEKRVASGHSRAMKSKWSKGQRSTISMKSLSVTSTPGSSATGGQRTSQVGMVTKMALQIRDQTNVACLDHARWMKHDVAKLREHVIKIEEEIKLGNKAKATLDARIFDLRKCLSVNQQSVSAQQKKSHKEVDQLNSQNCHKEGV